MCTMPHLDLSSLKGSIHVNTAGLTICTFRLLLINSTLVTTHQQFQTSSVVRCFPLKVKPTVSLSSRLPLPLAKAQSVREGDKPVITSSKAITLIITCNNGNNIIL